MGMILKEKEFKESLSNVNWSFYENKAVAVGCTTDAIIPVWAYMTIANYLYEFAVEIDYTTVSLLRLQLWKRNITKSVFSGFSDEKVVIRANSTIDPSLYVLATQHLKPFVKTLMFGEAGMPKVIYKK